ncbi:MAG: YybS family protein [Treponema sp.]|nr:YybS family protein [Treponema sp.]
MSGIFGKAALAAAASVIVLRTGYLSILFLLPLGMLRFSSASASSASASSTSTSTSTSLASWLGCFFALAGNAAVSLVFYRSYGSYAVDPRLLLINGASFGVMTVLYTWIEAPLLFKRTPYAYRLALGGIAGALALMPLIAGLGESREFREYLGAVSPGLDLSPEELAAVFERVRYAALRGGLLCSCIVLFALSRYAASIIFRVMRRTRGGGIISFKNARFLVYVLSCSLGMVVAGKLAAREWVEIAGWNILVLCGILYLAQGGGIVLFFLAKLPPLPRIAVNIGLVLLLLTPPANAGALLVTALLGVAENWAPFRTPQQNGPPPTPKE